MKAVVTMCDNTSRLFQSYTIPILHPSNLTHFQPYTPPMIHPSNLTLPIIHSSNPTLFQSYTLSVLNSSNPIFKCFTLPILHKIQLYFLAVPSQLNKLSIYPSHYNSILPGWSRRLASRHTFMFIKVRLLLICIIAEQ